jgi:hypothetical protein
MTDPIRGGAIETNPETGQIRLWVDADRPDVVWELDVRAAEDLRDGLSFAIEQIGGA